QCRAPGAYPIAYMQREQAELAALQLIQRCHLFVGRAFCERMRELGSQFLAVLLRLCGAPDRAGLRDALLVCRSRRTGHLAWLAGSAGALAPLVGRFSPFTAAFRF